jgi:fibronectin type 3 domain-containing protein
MALCPSAKAQTIHHIDITWTYVQGTDLAVGFNVYRSTTTGGPYAKLNATPLTLATLLYQDFSGTGNIKYFFVVTAVDISGIESLNSNEVNAIFLASSPLAPQNATAVAK